MLQLGIYNNSSGSLYLDASPRASGVEIVNGEHGFGTLTAFIKMSLPEAFMLYDRPGLPHMQLTEFGVSVWEGRLEDVAIVAGGVRLTAFGYWRALSDAPYTALWSSTSMAGWRPVIKSELSSHDPQMYVTDTNNRLYMATMKGNTYGNGINQCELTVAAPNGAQHPIVAISFSYSMLLPANWELRVRRMDENFSSVANIQTIVATGILQTGTVNTTFTGQNRLGILIFNNTGAGSTPAGETGINFAEITNLRIKVTTASTVLADAIIGPILVFANGINSAQISSSSALVSSPGVDLTDETYQDAMPADVIDHLAALGDSSTPIALYEAGVWEDQLLSFQKRGSTAKTWYVDISELELERTIDQLYNSAYADYQEASGRTLRTAGSTDSDSRSRFGLIRQRAIQASTTSSTLAGTLRNAAVQDGKDPAPRISINFERVYDGAGSPYPLWMVRAWDTIVIRNLPATLSTQLDRIRQFRTIEARYNVDTDKLTVTPESYKPTLDVLVARRAAGIRTWAGPPVVQGTTIEGIGGGVRAR